MWSSSRIAGALLALVFISLVVIPIVEAACPHNCSGHGVCSHNTCTCNAGYTGSDCSMRIVALQSGQLQEDSLNTFTWRYYSIVVPAGASALNITVHQTNAWGDVDTYVSRGTLPTFTDYLARDITTNKNYEIAISPAPPGTYYIGQYAYFHVEYTIQADIIVSCAVDCGEHGSCVGESCQCHPNWSGEICNVYDELLVSGQTAYNTVQDQQWVYYHINVNARQTMLIHVEQNPTPNQNCDVDVYVKKNEFPSMFDFNFANATINPITELSLRDPGAGLWYIGVYGYRGCAFSIVVTVSEMQGCLSECSRHGTCIGNVCSCNPGFSGDACESKDTLIQLGVPETGYVGRTEWNYYKLQVDTTNSILVAVSQDSASADCDLFVKRDSRPSNFDFDYSNLSFEQFFNVTINDPSTATWYIGVYGWTDCGYTMTASIPTTCACAEPYHGRCAPNSAQCICENGWSGDRCDQQENLMHNGEVYSDGVTLNHWQYYRITADSSAMLISMKESETVGRLWLFASLNGFPALDSYAKADISTKSEFHEVHFVFEERGRRVFYIGVYGSPFSPTEVEMPFTITAWAPPF